MKVMQVSEIKDVLNIQHAIALQEEGFALYSKGKVKVPPVGHMNFGQEVGEVHIKYGWVELDFVHFQAADASSRIKDTTISGEKLATSSSIPESL